MTATTDEAASLQAEARRLYAESIEAEMPLSGKALGERFGRSERWGRDRVAEVRQQAAAAAATAATAATGAAAERLPVPAGRQPVEVERQPQRQPEMGAAVPAAAGPAAAAAVALPVTAGRQASGNGGSGSGSRDGIGWARAGFWLGLGVSIAANVLHALEPGVPRAAVVGSAIWPVLLLIAVEILSRVSWGSHRGQRWAGLAGAAAVAIVAAIASYQHMRGLLLSWGEGAFLASIGPLAVDGLMVLAGMALMVTGRENEHQEVTR